MFGHGGSGGGSCFSVVGLLVLEFFWPKYHFWLYFITMVTIL